MVVSSSTRITAESVLITILQLLQVLLFGSIFFLEIPVNAKIAYLILGLVCFDTQLGLYVEVHRS